ncbi:MAG: peptidase U32 family protein, partial [Clostridia bacterium]
MELLAPAGSEEALLAAVRNGADAVYLGYTAFGARGSAANFDEAQLRKAVRFCHAHGVRVHVTVNTLVKQAEMQQVMSLFSLLCEVGADAVIVQDFGVLACLRAEFPTLPVHASTQMALHNVQGVQFARAQGVRRVVAARECTMGDLRAMAGVGL